MRALNLIALSSVLFAGCGGSGSPKQGVFSGLYDDDTFGTVPDLQVTITDVDGVHDVGDASAAWNWMQATDGCTAAWHLRVTSLQSAAVDAELGMSVSEEFTNGEPVLIDADHDALLYSVGNSTDLHWVKRYRGGQAVRSLQPDGSVLLQFSGGELCRGELPDLVCTPDGVTVGLSTDAIPVSDRCHGGHEGWNEDVDGNRLCISEYFHESVLCAPDYDAP